MSELDAVAADYEDSSFIPMGDLGPLFMHDDRNLASNSSLMIAGVRKPDLADCFSINHQISYQTDICCLHDGGMHTRTCEVRIKARMDHRGLVRGL